jgi:hypothetical protein
MSEHHNPIVSGIHQITYKQPGGYEPTEATEAVRTRVDRVEGQTVILRQSSAGLVTSERLTAEQSAFSTVEARSAQLSQSAVQRLDAERAVAEHSRILATSAGSVRLVKSQAVLVKADHAQIEGGRIFWFIGRADGPITATLTPTSAAILGAALGIGLTLASALLRLIRGQEG